MYFGPFSSPPPPPPTPVRVKCKNVKFGPMRLGWGAHVAYPLGGIFQENDFKYQNARDNEFGGAISANYAGFFTISCLLLDTLRAGMAP